MTGWYTGGQVLQPEITLFTSIPPSATRKVQGRDFGLAWQTACIESWKAVGYRVVSLNPPDEIDTVRSFAPTIEFSSIPKGRIRPLITDFFVAAGGSESKIAGIINADCMMVRPFEFSRSLTEHIDGLVIADRLNIRIKPTQLTPRMVHQEPTDKVMRVSDAFTCEPIGGQKKARVFEPTTCHNNGIRLCFVSPPATISSLAIILPLPRSSAHSIGSSCESRL